MSFGYSPEDKIREKVAEGDDEGREVLTVDDDLMLALSDGKEEGRHELFLGKTLGVGSVCLLGLTQTSGLRGEVSA